MLHVVTILVLISIFLPTSQCFFYPLYLSKSAEHRTQPFRHLNSSDGPELCNIEEDSAASRFVRRGRPSSPGWKNPSDLDRLTDWVTCDEANRPIICEYNPDALTLWTKYYGTALSITKYDILCNMFLGVLVDRYAHFTSESTWRLLSLPPSDDHLIQQLVGMNNLWGYQLTLVTFILAFFTSQSYNFWRSVYFTTRAIQGRINDICLLITMSATRSQPEGNKMNSFYDDEAADLVQTCSRLIRLSHTFFWASTPTSSNGLENFEIGPLLLSQEGLRSLVEAHELTSNEVDALLKSGLPPSQYTYILVEWVALYVIEGIENGTLRGGVAMQDNLLKQFTNLRAEYFNIGDYAAGRMPLAYVQLVQVLVDTLVWLAPISLYSSLGSLSIPAVGLLTLFFKGLMELSKSFLDPFGNEGYPAQNIRIDVLVSELNFGASSRWVKAAETLPCRENPQDQC